MTNLSDSPKSTAGWPPIHATDCFIGGQWMPAASGKTFPTIHPATEEEIAQIAEGDKEDIDRAVMAARRQFDGGEWARMDSRDRGLLIQRVADLLEENTDELASLEALDNGKPRADALRDDIPAAVDCLRYNAGWADKIHGDTIPVRGSYFCYTTREPVGVVGQIIPWNFPALMAAWKWGPALAAGCTIVMKPAEQTPLSCLRMASLAQQAGIPDGVINVVPGFGSVAGSALVRHPGVDKIAFTGASSTAKLIQLEASETVKRLTFELGGKNPMLLFADADLDLAVEQVHAAQFYNQGQSCSAGSRLYVHESIGDEVIERLKEIIQNWRVGDPFNASIQQGPLVDRAQLEKVLGYIDIGDQEGATRVAGGERIGDRGFFVQPTLFADVADDMRICREEIFGPVLSVLSFRDTDEVIRRANDTNYGLTAGIWTNDLQKAHYVARRLRTGTSWINCYDVFDAAAPFGGFKQSGIGRELGAAGLEPYTELRTVTVSL